MSLQLRVLKSKPIVRGCCWISQSTYCDIFVTTVDSAMNWVWHLDFVWVWVLFFFLSFFFRRELLADFVPFGEGRQRASVVVQRLKTRCHSIWPVLAQQGNAKRSRFYPVIGRQVERRTLPSLSLSSWTDPPPNLPVSAWPRYRQVPLLAFGVYVRKTQSFVSQFNFSVLCFLAKSARRVPS